MTHARNDILDWAERGLIAPDKLRAALEVGGALPSAVQWRQFLDRLLLWMGSVMLAAAVIFFLAYNWNELGRYAKFGLVEGLVAAALGVAWKQGLERPAGKAALFAAALLVGALLALVGQTYQTGADPWELFAVWAAMILPWSLIARLPALWLLVLVLANLATVLYFQAFHSLFDVVFGPQRQIWMLFAMNTAALAAWELLGHSERWAARIVASASGTLAATLAIFDVFDDKHSAWGVLAWALWLAAAYVVYRRHLKDIFVLAGGALSAIVVVAALLTRHMRMTDAGTFLFIGLLVIGMSAAAGFWLKNIAAEEGE